MFIAYILKDSIFRRQDPAMVYLPVSTAILKQLPGRSGGNVMLFVGADSAGEGKSTYAGLYRVSGVKKRNAVPKADKVLGGLTQSRFIETWKVKPPPSSDISWATIERSGVVSESNPRFGEFTRGYAIVQLTETQFHEVVSYLSENVHALEKKLSDTGKLLQRRITDDWVYDVRDRKLFRRDRYIALKTTDDDISNLVRSRIAAQSDYIDRLWTLLTELADKDIFSLSPDNFERRVARLLTDMGFIVNDTQKTGDGGVDAWVKDPNFFTRATYVVQCKRTQGRVGPDVVRQLHSVALTNRASKGILISVGGFTTGAEQEAAQTIPPVELLTWENLLEWLSSTRHRRNRN